MENLEELKEYLEEKELYNTQYFEEPDYASAVIGTTDDDRLVYDYEKMVEHVMNLHNWDRSEAMEFIDFNTINSLNMAPFAPIVVYPLDNP